MKKIEGLVTALLTPFLENGDLDEKSLRDYVNYNIEEMKVNGLYVGGSTGEAFLLSTEERCRVYKIVSEETKGRVSLTSMVGSINIREACELGAFAKNVGYDAISAVTPFYYGFSFDEVLIYYKKIIKEAGMPMMVYFIPALTGMKFSLDQFKQLLTLDSVFGVKFSSPDLYTLERIRSLFPDKTICFGVDEQFISSLAFGVDGGIGSTYNVMGDQYAKICSLYAERDIEKACSVQKNVNSVTEMLLQVGVFNGLKAILHLEGMTKNSCREPFKPLTKEQESIISKTWAEYKKNKI